MSHVLVRLTKPSEALNLCTIQKMQICAVLFIKEANENENRAVSTERMSVCLFHLEQVPNPSLLEGLPSAALWRKKKDQFAKWQQFYFKGLILFV